MLGSAFAQHMILLASSATFGMASLAVKHERERPVLLGWLEVTLALAAVFLSLELRNFADMFARGAYPTRSGCLSAFFELVPLHGLPVSAGIVLGLVLMVQIVKLGLTTPFKTR